MKNNKLIGIKNLYKVETDDSDYWIRQKINKYEVYEPHLKNKLLIGNSMNEALEYIKNITKIRKKVETWYKED